MKKLMLLALMCIMTSLFTNNVDSVTTHVAVAETSEYSFEDNYVERELKLPSISVDVVKEAGGYLSGFPKESEYSDSFYFRNVNEVNNLYDQFEKIADDQDIIFSPTPITKVEMLGVGYRQYSGNFYAEDGEFDFGVVLDWYTIKKLKSYVSSCFPSGCIAKIPLLLIDTTPILYANIDIDGEVTYTYCCSSFNLYGAYYYNGVGLQSNFFARVKFKLNERINSISTLCGPKKTISSDFTEFDFDTSYLELHIPSKTFAKMYSLPFEILSYNVASGVVKLGNFVFRPATFKELKLKVPKFDKENNIIGYIEKKYTSDVVKMEIVDYDDNPINVNETNDFIVKLSNFPMQFTKNCRIEFLSFDFNFFVNGSNFATYKGHYDFTNIGYLKDRFAFAYYYDEASGYFRADVKEVFFEDNNAGVVQVNAMSYIPLLGLINQGVDAYQNKYEWNEQYFIFDMYDLDDNKLKDITMMKMKYQKGYWHANKDNLDINGKPSTYSNDPKNPQKDVRIEDIKVGDFSREELYYTDSHNNRIRKPGLRYFKDGIGYGDAMQELNDQMASLLSQIFSGSNSYLYYLSGAYFYYNNFRDGQIDNRISYMAPLEIWFFNQELGSTQRLVGNFDGLHVVTDDNGKDIVIDLDGKVREEFGAGVDPETGAKFVGQDKNGDGVISSDESIDPDLVYRDTTKGDDLDNTNAQTKNDPIAILKRTIGIALGVVGVSIVIVLIAKGVTKLRQNRYYRETHHQYKSNKRKRKK